MSNTMELSERFIQVKSTAKHEKDFPSFTQDDIVFLFGDVARPLGLILNNNDPLECYVLFPPTTPMQEIVTLTENPSWVGTSMQLGLHKPSSSMLAIASRLLQGKDLEEDEEYEYISIQPLDPGIPEDHSTPKKKGGPAAPNALSHELKHMPTQEPQQVLTSLQQEMRTRQDASMGSVHDVSSVLQTLLKEGALRTNAADVVHNMGSNVPLDMILKRFTTIYGNVKSFDLLMRDFYRADQGKDETIPSYATRIEGLLSQIRDKFPDQLPLQEEQRLLKDWLFHGSRKSIWDSLKYCFADASIDYMQFLEECEKSEEEGKAGQARAPAKAKLRAAAATLPPNKDDGLSKQL